MRRAAIWSRVFALAYDPFLWLAKRSGMRKLRRELLARACGRVLEIGSGTGLNVEHFGDGVTELVLSEPELLLHVLLGRPGPAVEWLRTAADGGWPCYPHYANDPNLAKIRTDARYIAFMSELKERWERYRTLF